MKGEGGQGKNLPPPDKEAGVGSERLAVVCPPRFRVQGLRFEVWGLEIEDWQLGIWGPSFGFQILG